MGTQCNVTILGSGTCVPSLRRSSCSVLVESGDDTLVFDLGSGTIRRLLENRTPINRITHLFLSHFHPDHCGELVSLIFSLKAPELCMDFRHLTLVAGAGFSRLHDGLRQAFGRHVELDPSRFTVVEVDVEGEDCRDFGGFRLITRPMVHSPESVAFRVETAGRSFVYSGDTDYCENLILLAKNADALVCECSAPDAGRIERHLTPSLAGEMAARAGVKKLILTHFYPDCEKTDIAKECRKTYDGPLFLAEDLMKIRL